MTSVHFGGPDRPERALRDLLESRVEAVPEGGSIDWMTYYFCDVALAEALVRAHERGVAVRVCVEGYPRNRGANEPVIDRLERGIGAGLRVERRLFGASHLHTKLYCFSAPQPHALVGSFNPSGNEPEDAALIADIGDQDRGHNLLVEIDQAELVRTFVERVASIHAGKNPFRSLAAARHATATANRFEAAFFPRRGGNPLDARLAQLGPGAKLRIAASHIADLRVRQQLAALVERSASVEVLTHHTLRRSPKAVVDYLRRHGIRTWRYQHPQELPMHAKFMLADDAGRRWSAFGSYNLTRTSRWLNQELLVFADDAELWNALDARWNTILAEPCSTA